MRVLIDRLEIRVTGEDERARGERLGRLLRGRLGSASPSPDGAAPATGTPAARTPQDGGAHAA